MPPVIVEPPSREGDAVFARVIVEGTAVTLGYRATPGPIAGDADPFLAAALLPAMAVKQPIHVQGAVAPRLLGSIHRIQGTLSAWKIGLTETPVHAEPRAVGSRSEEVGAFFSGGVDSFYTAIERLDQVDALIFLLGFDIAPDRKVRSKEVIDGAEKAAAELGKRLVVIETDYRVWATRYVEWRYAAGGIIGSSALALAPQFGTIVVPASHSYADAAPPYGTHPLLDPFWSTEEVEVVHHGYEATRLEKVMALADNEVFLRWVRTCHRPIHEGTYNCGRCEKCVRAMIYLWLAGTLDRCTAFPNRLDPEVVARVLIWPTNMIPNWESDLRTVEASGKDPAIAGAMRHAIRRARAARLKKQLSFWRRSPQQRR
jgi:hypothetical protein